MEKPTETETLSFVQIKSQVPSAMQLIRGRGWYTWLTPELLKITGQRAFGSRTSSHGTAEAVKGNWWAVGKGWCRLCPKESWIPSMDLSTLHLCMQVIVAYAGQHSQKYKSQEELKLQAVGTWVICEVLSDISCHHSEQDGDCCQPQFYVGNWDCISPSLPRAMETATSSRQKEGPAGLKVLAIQDTNCSRR